MKHTSRRTFLKGSLTAGLAIPMSTWTRAQGANDRINVGVIGARGQGKGHYDDALKSKNGGQAVAVCDVDSEVVAARLKDADDAGVKVTGYADYRKMLEDKNIDAVIIATPNHTHTLIAIAALQAGKHVYVEKPVSHNIHEGRILVQHAAAHSKLICQHGMQRRSDDVWMKIMEFIKTGAIGKPVVSRGFCYKKRENIGKVAGPQKPPSTVDYSLWCGPREMEPLLRQKFHYDWHWQWQYGNGDIGNQGPHQLDVARWLLGDPGELPGRVISVGGRFGYDDDATTANTQIAFYDFKPIPMIFEVRGLPEKDMNFRGRLPYYKGVQVGNVIECEGGYVAEGKAYSKDGAELAKFPKDDGAKHRRNFFKNILNGTIPAEHNALTGHMAGALAHMANHSYRLGGLTPQEEIKAKLKDSPLFTETFERMLTHLKDNKLEADLSKIVLGPMLTLDPKTEKYTGDFADKANAMDMETYRPEFALPKV